VYGQGVSAPLYSLIADRAEGRIRSGAWAPGTRLPPERELCRELEVSRATLRQALDELEERGLITRHQGRGTFVTRPRVQPAISGFFSIREALIARGATIVTRVLQVARVDASRQVAAELGLLPGDPVLHVERLRIVDGEPIVLEAAWLPAALFPGLEAADLAKRSLYDVLREDFGRRVAEAQETIEPVILTPHECGLLGVPRHTPAILTRRVTSDRDGTIVELSQALLRGDRSRLLLVRRVAETPDGADMRATDAGTPGTPEEPPRGRGIALDAAELARDLVPAGDRRPRHAPRPLPALTRTTVAR
jgi:GntR family transcriptional regulator